MLVTPTFFLVLASSPKLESLGIRYVLLEWKNLPFRSKRIRKNSTTTNETETTDACGCETTDLWGNFIAEADAVSVGGVTGCVLAFSGVLIGEYEVRESWDGDVKCHGGKGASKVAENTNKTTVLETLGYDVIS